MAVAAPLAGTSLTLFLFALAGGFLAVVELILSDEERTDLRYGPWQEARFWDEVGDEVNVETLRWRDFTLFVSPSGPLEPPDPAFSDDLREHLRGLVRRLYTS